MRVNEDTLDYLADKFQHSSMKERGYTFEQYVQTVESGWEHSEAKEEETA